MEKEIMNQVAKMTVAEMRKAASQYGIKNTKKYKRAELEQMMVDAMVKVAKEKAEAEKIRMAAEKARLAISEKKATKAEKSDKRYKATELKATKEEIEAMAAEVISNLANVDLFQVNRKVLIVVMKNLKCERWYRTYDKPTMVSKIMAAA